MASIPAYATTPVIAIGQVSTANTARDGTGTIATVIPAVTVPTLIRSIRVKATADPADSIVTLFLHDGTNFRLFDEIDLGDPAAGSTTVPAYNSGPLFYDDLVLPVGWSLRAAITVAPTAGVVNVIAMGATL